MEGNAARSGSTGSVGGGSGGPREIAPLGLPRIRTCATRASGSSRHGFATRATRDRACVSAHLSPLASTTACPRAAACSSVTRSCAATCRRRSPSDSAALESGSVRYFLRTDRTSSADQRSSSVSADIARPSVRGRRRTRRSPRRAARTSCAGNTRTPSSSSTTQRSGTSLSNVSAKMLREKPWPKSYWRQTSRARRPDRPHGRRRTRSMASSSSSSGVRRRTILSVPSCDTRRRYTGPPERVGKGAASAAYRAGRRRSDLDPPCAAHTRTLLPTAGQARMTESADASGEVWVGTAARRRTGLDVG